MSCHQNAIPFVLLLVSITPTSLVLGSPVSDTIARRSDPLRKLKHYGGDYDIRNRHYWASAAFTGIHGYAVAGLWLLSGIGFGIFILVKNLGGSTSRIPDHPHSSDLIIFWLIVLFTIFGISASGVIIAADQKTLQRADKLEETVFGAGDNVSQIMGSVDVNLGRMQTFLVPYDSKTSDLLDLIGRQLSKESHNIHSFVENTRRTFHRAIQTLYMVNLVVASINLALLVAGLVLLTLQYRPGILVLIFSCWILTTLTWILTGLDFFFHTFIEDTCSTLKNFEEDPENNVLTEMLPCPKSTDSSKTLEKINYSVHNFIAEINSKIREVLETNEDSGDQIPILEVCDPFSSAPDYSYSPENCGENSIPIGNLPSILSNFICYEANATSGTCLAQGRFLPQSAYNISLAFSQSIQDFINIYPDLSSLMNCRPVKQAFADIVVHQCRPIKQWTQALWASTLSLSLVMVVLVLFWSDKAIQDRGRCLSRWSIFPRPLQQGC